MGGLPQAMEKYSFHRSHILPMFFHRASPAEANDEAFHLPAESRQNKAACSDSTHWKMFLIPYKLYQTECRGRPRQRGQKTGTGGCVPHRCRRRAVDCRRLFHLCDSSCQSNFQALLLCIMKVQITSAACSAFVRIAGCPPCSNI